ncbi:MAG: Na/Pi cotransporter family protein [Nitritalea sp.]
MPTPTTDFEFWKFAAGLGMFLFGMHQLEAGLKGLTGRSFQRLLQRATNTPWKGISVGTIVTAILQSSSLVNLLVLAFLGGGVMSLKNSLSVVLGANLGTTFTAWIVATLGFKVNVADLAFPWLTIGILSALFLTKRPLLKSIGGFLMGFGLIFLGLDYMKVTMEAYAAHLDISGLEAFGLWAFLAAGLIVTALIQSSSAMIVIVLSALHAGLLDIYQAVAMVIGASVGTSSTLVLGSLSGSADKKRLSFGNLIFKGVAGLFCFALLHPLVALSLKIGIQDPLMELVFLNTLINVISILLFYPFLGPMERFLNRRFSEPSTAGVAQYLPKVPVEVPEVALSAIENEVQHLYRLTEESIQEVMRTDAPKEKTGTWKRLLATETDPFALYGQIKGLEDEITAYFSELQELPLEEQEVDKLNTLIMSTRSLVFAAKAFKDIQENVQHIYQAGKPEELLWLEKSSQFVRQQLQEMQGYAKPGEYVEALPPWPATHDRFYQERLAETYEYVRQSPSAAMGISTRTNVLRQITNGLNNLSSALYYWKTQQETVPS